MRLKNRLPNWENASSPSHISAFDLDHTLLTGNCSFRFGRFLYQNHRFSFLTMLHLSGCYALHKMGVLSIPSMQCKIFKKLFLGHSKPDIDAQTIAFIDQHLESMLYPPAIEKLHSAQQSGHYTLILSSSPSFIVSKVAERLGVHAWASTEYAVDHSQRFSAIAHFMQGEDKANYMTTLAHRLKIQKSQITAYSDSILDLPFLRAAGHPVGVNPDRPLRTLCRQNHWTVI